MKSRPFKIIVYSIFIGLALLTYTLSASGFGVSGLNNPKTKARIQENCPNYYQSRNGECLRTTFRTYYLVRGFGGGGFGSGK